MNKPPKHVLQSLYAHPHATISSVAKHVGVSQPTVRKWLIDYQIPRKTHQQASAAAAARTSTQVDPDQFCKLYQAGYSIDQLESHFKIGQARVLTLAHQLGVYKPHNERCSLSKQSIFAEKQIDPAVVERALNRHQYVEDVIAELNISRGHLRTLMSRYDLTKHWVGTSRAQRQLFDAVEAIVPGWIYNDRTTIAPYELDIVHPQLKIAIEYCGLYWHGETAGKGRQYHRMKYLACQQNGITLYTVWETDSVEKVLATVRRKVNCSRVGARSCQVISLTRAQAAIFHKNHHVEGSVGGNYHLGLVKDGELLMAASFAKSRYDKHHLYECMRVSSADTQVVGGTSKLFSHFRKLVDTDSICSYANLRFGSGSVYQHCGLVRVKDTSPGYHYFKHNTIYSRVMFQKHKLSVVLPQFDPQLTEWENMKLAGYDRIWDCGHAKYVSPGNTTDGV